MQFKRISKIIFILILTTFAISACGNLPDILQSAATESPETIATVPPTPIPTDEASTVNTPQAITLHIWVSPQFAPDTETEAGALFQARLDEFAQRHPGVRVAVRVKAETGEDGLYTALGATANAAPLALPDLIALPSTQMQLAANKNYINPLTPYLFNATSEDWFKYAQEMGDYENIQFGIPFAGDVMVMGYRSAQIEELPITWQFALENRGVFAFPAGDPLAIFTLLQYQANGGALHNQDGEVTLTENEIRQILSIYEQGQYSGLLPYWLTQYDTEALAWQAFRENRAQMAVTWYTQFSADPPTGTGIAPLPTNNGSPFSYARGWTWSLSGTDPTRYPIAVELAEFLSEGDFLAAWNAALGTLPTRPSALSTWEPGTEQAVLSQILPNAILLPDTLTISSLSLPLHDAVIGVLKQEWNATEAASDVVKEISP